MDAAAEAELLSRARWDPSAVEALLRGQLDRIYGVCLAIVRDPEVAAELSQEALLRLYRSLPEFRGECAFGTWAWRVARNLALNWRARARERAGEDGTALPDPRPQAPEVLAADQRARGVRQALAQLSDPEREALLLHYEVGLSVEEVTELMGLQNRSGARGLLQRARRKLRRSAQQALPEDSIVLRAHPADAQAQAREALEATLTRLRVLPEGPEPRLRPMPPRQRLIDPAPGA